MTQHDSQKRYRFYGPRMPIFPSEEALYAYENAMNASKLPDQPGQSARPGRTGRTGQTDRVTPPVPDAVNTPAAGESTGALKARHDRNDRYDRYDSNYPCNRCDRNDQCSRCAWLKGAIDRTQETHPDLYRMMKAAWNDMRRREREAYQAKLRAMTWKESIARWRRLLNEGFSDEDRAYLFVNEFEESEHKRDKDGKFATMDGGGAKSRAKGAEEEVEDPDDTKVIAKRAAHAAEIQQIGPLVDGSGAFVPERIKRVLESETMDTFVEPEDAPAPWEPISQKFNPHTPFDAPPGSKRTFYIVARRPLATPVIGSAAALSDWNHLQFIADDGTNIGLFKEEGYSADRKDQWDKYAQTNYVKYDADIMEEAMRIHMRDNKGREYNLRQYNCIDYVNEVLEIAEKLASEKNLPLEQNFYEVK